MAALLGAALWRGRGRASAVSAAWAATFWLGLEWLSADSRLLFPFAMGCAGAAAWRWGWKGAAAGGALFLMLRILAGASAAVLMTETLGTALSLLAALAARRTGAAASVAAGSLTGLAALLL